jgi:hypothetical protein
MATALEVITGALKALGIKPAESSIEAVEAADGLEALNDMMNEWDVDGITIGYETVEDVSDEIYVDDGALGAIKANLAVYIAPEYSRIVTNELALRARNGKRALRRSLPIAGSEFPDTLPVGSGNEDEFTSNGDVPGGFSGTFYPANTTSKCN